MPTRPGEVLIGKIVPYILFGYVQVTVILLAARFLIHVPMHGSIPVRTRWCCSLSRPTSRWASRSHSRADQLQTMQMTFFIFLPSLLLWGFMFPCCVMPGWAQVIGEVSR